VAHQVRFDFLEANILKFNGIVLSVVDNVLVASETPVMNSSTLRICRLNLRKCNLCSCVHSVCYECLNCVI